MGEKTGRALLGAKRTDLQPGLTLYTTAKPLCPSLPEMALEEAATWPGPLLTFNMFTE